MMTVLDRAQKFYEALGWGGQVIQEPSSSRQAVSPS
jgi:hypothetical protein